MERCRSCQGKGLIDLGPCAAYVRPEDAGFPPGRLWRCPTCWLVMRDPSPTAEALLQMYRADKIRPMPCAYEQRAAWGATRTVLLKRLAGRDNVRILDVGCHSGGFLSGLPKMWRRFGIEAEGQPAEIARRTHDVELISERIESVQDTWHGQFDVVTMFDVLEHLLDPSEGLRNAARLLRPEGLLIFSTSDYDAWTWRWLGSGHWYMQTPQHLTVISSRYVQNLAKREGWSVQSLQSLPALDVHLRERLRQTAKLFYWYARGRGAGWRVYRRVLQSLPGYQALRHMNAVPWTLGLRDHIIAVVRVRAIARSSSL